MKNQRPYTLLSKQLILLSTFFAVIAPIFNYAFRIAYVFIDMMLFKGLNLIVLSAMIVNAVYMLAFSYSYLYKRTERSKPERIMYYTSFYLTILFNTINAIFFIKSPSDVNVFSVYLLRMLPYLGVLFLTLLLIYVFPRLKNFCRKSLGLLVIIAVLAGICVPMMHLYPFKFQSEPLVLDNGKEYIIIWATNDKAAGYVEYSYDNTDYRVYHAESGKIVASQIHRVHVPYSHLTGNSYSVHSTRVLDELSYGGTNGRTISSKTYAFKGEIKDNINILAVSDWHCSVKQLKMAASWLDAPDLVIMLGDAANSYNHINDVIKYIINAGAIITGSEFPAIFVRGNHDARGEAVTHLGYYLGLSSFYYEVERGNYKFLVLDSGEDKKDSDPEYGGLTDYESYKTKQAEWMSTLSPSTSAFTFTLCHDRSFHHSEALSSLWKSEIIRYNTDFVLSGHSHKSIIIEGNDYNTILVGGRNSTFLKDVFGNPNYIASQLTITDGSIILKSVDQTGKIYLESSL